MITALYASFIALVFLALSVRVIAYRRENKIGLGDDGDKSLMKRMRAQANCAEYAPIALVLLLILELQSAPAVLVHLIGAMLLAGRIAHGYGFSASPPIMRLRVAGTLLTLTSIALAALANLLFSLL